MCRVCGTPVTRSPRPPPLDRLPRKGEGLGPTRSPLCPQQLELCQARRRWSAHAGCLGNGRELDPTRLYLANISLNVFLTSTTSLPAARDPGVLAAPRRPSVEGRGPSPAAASGFCPLQG